MSQVENNNLRPEYQKEDQLVDLKEQIAKYQDQIEKIKLKE